MAEHHAVDYVAERAAQHQRQAARPSGFRRVAVKAGHDEGGGDEPDRDEKPALPAAGVGQEAECGAGVVHEHQPEKRQHRNGLLVVDAEETPTW